MKAMRIDIKHVLAAAVVGVEGDIDMASSPRLREAILELLRESGQDKVVVNMASVSYIDSSAVATLVEAAQMASKRKVRFLLSGLNEGPLHVLQLTRLIDVFDVRASEEDALEA